MKLHAGSIVISAVFVLIALAAIIFVQYVDPWISEQSWVQAASEFCKNHPFLEQEKSLASEDDVTILKKGVICAKRGIAAAFLVTYNEDEKKIIFAFNFSFSEKEWKELRKNFHVVGYGRGPDMNHIELTLPCQTDPTITGLADLTGLRPEKTYVACYFDPDNIIKENKIKGVMKKVKRAIGAQYMVMIDPQAI